MINVSLCIIMYHKSIYLTKYKQKDIFIYKIYMTIIVTFMYLMIYKIYDI